MNRHLKVFMAGILVIVPLAITVYVIWSIGAWLDDLGGRALKGLGLGEDLPPVVGAAAVLAGIYLAGLLSRLVLFRGLMGRLERAVERVPGVKTVYQSIRDLLHFFGGDPSRMGRAVLYKPPGTDIAVLGVLTNERPDGPADETGQPKVAVYLPFSYMLGGPTLYVSRRHLTDAGMSVEQALKLCATAHVTAQAPAKDAAEPPPARDES